MSSDFNKILILGSSGFVGRHLLQALGSSRTISTYCKSPIPGGVAFSLPQSKLVDVLEKPQEISHAVILLGETHIDTCANQLSSSQAVNVTGIIGVIEELYKLNIKPIFASTDHVFDGAKGGYKENDTPTPIVAYGRQKRAVEEYLEQTANEYCIVRLSKVYGSDPLDGTLFTAWHRALRDGASIDVASDQIFSPIHINDVISGILELINQPSHGTYHFCGPDSMSRLCFLEELMKIYGRSTSITSRVEQRSINDFELTETRPIDVSMLSTRIQSELGMAPRSYKQILPELIEGQL